MTQADEVVQRLTRMEQKLDEQNNLLLGKGEKFGLVTKVAIMWRGHTIVAGAVGGLVVAVVTTLAMKLFT